LGRYGFKGYFGTMNFEEMAVFAFSEGVAHAPVEGMKTTVGGKFNREGGSGEFRVEENIKTNETSKTNETKQKEKTGETIKTNEVKQEEKVTETKTTEVNKIEKLRQLAEQNAKKQVEQIEKSSPGAHFDSRHGAGTTLKEQEISAKTGLRPDGAQQKPVDSSRFLTYQIEFQSIQRAETIFKQTGQTTFSFNMEIPTGEGYLKGGVTYKTSTTAQAVFKNGKIYTLYPLLK
jgi:hypothetical protein